jgi:hypothetical protein
MATMYFQRQHGLQCTLHACNNAIGAKVLIAADLNKAADDLALAMATRSQEAQRRTGTGRTEELESLQARCRMALVGPAGGQWSADCAWHALAKKGYFAHRRATADFDFKGDWIVLGDKFHNHNARPYAHAVALRGNMWLDSEASSPCMLVDLELPTNFRPWGYFQVDQVPPPPTAPPEEVDLTRD